MIVIFGGTGRVGRQVTDLLAREGAQVRVVARSPGRAAIPQGVEVLNGDLHDGDAVFRALQGAEALVCSAHGGDGKGKNGPKGVEGVEGVAIPRLIDAAKGSALRQFVYFSTASAHADSPVEFFRMKYAVEEHLRSSGLPYSIIRPTHLMDTWMPMLAKSIAGKGKATVIGAGDTPVSWVAGADLAHVAAALAGQVGDGFTADFGGPEALSLRQVNELIAVTLDVPVRTERKTSAGMVAMMSRLMKPFNEVLSRQLSMGAFLDSVPQRVDASVTWRRFGVTPTPLRGWLGENLPVEQKKEDV